MTAMHGWMDGWMDGWTDGRTEGGREGGRERWRDGGMDGAAEVMKGCCEVWNVLDGMRHCIIARHDVGLMAGCTDACFNGFLGFWMVVVACRFCMICFKT